MEETEYSKPVLNDETPLLKYLAGLTPEDVNKLKDILSNQYQSEVRGTSLTDYFEVVQSVYNTNFNSVGNTPHTRNQRYEVYDEMDESTAYITSALNILSDDATQADSDGVIVHIESESPKVSEIIEDLFTQYDIEEKISKWTRATAKYGDFFIKVEGTYGEGISYINDSFYPGIIDRRDLNGKLLAFIDNQDMTYSADTMYAPWEFVHFRHKGDIYKDESKNNRVSGTKDRLEKNLTSAYGQSVLRPAIKVYAQLRFVENMMLLSRLTNSIRRNIFSINVGDVGPDKAFEHIAKYAKLLKKNVNLNIEEGIYSSSRHTINYDEDIFLPVNDPKNDIRIDQVGGDVNIREQYDLEYLLNKLFAALGIPKAYLNYEQDLNARSTLIQLDIRYARSVSQLQNTVQSGLMRLAKIHLAYLGLDPDEVDLKIYLTPVSAIDEDARTEQLQKQVGVARDTWDLLTSMKDSLDSDTPLDLKVAAKKIMTDYLGLDQETVDTTFGEIPEAQVTRLRNSKQVYRNSDIHEAYPTQDELTGYKKLVESLVLNEQQ